MDDQRVVLVVDDVARERAYYHRVLEWAGFETVLAPDGAEALDLLRAGHFDLVVADIKMPRLDGYELFQITRNTAQLADMPFLFITAYGPCSEVRHSGTQASVCPHLTKPVEPSALVEAISLSLKRLPVEDPANSGSLR